VSTINGPIDAVLLDVGGVFLVPRQDGVLAALEPFAADPDRLLAGHYAGIAAMDAAGYFDWKVYATAYVATTGVRHEQRADAAAALDAILMGPGLWSDVIPGSVPSLERLAATGVPIGIVSNADGTVEAELLSRKVCQVGEGECTSVAVVVDSTVAGIEKPDPRIFTVALDALGAAPERVVMVGDTIHTDVHGARAAGIHPLHLDPFGFCPAPDDHAHVRSLDDVAALVVSSRGG
jgi:putative hydrolase of the HAD superfamily